MKTKTISNPISVKQRGCGWPKQGKIYLSIPTGAYGTPIWNFTIDPTMPLPENFEIKTLGMQLISRGCSNKEGKEIFDIWDWIGGGAYPNPSDWLLEVSHLGLHQLIERNARFDLLTVESYYIAIHARANIVDPYEFYENRRDGDDFPVCPYEYPAHLDLSVAFLEEKQTCPSILFNDLIKGEPTTNGREVIRKMPSFSYKGYMSPLGALDPEHLPAAFFKAPIGAIGTFLVYEDPEQNEHVKALKALEALDEALSRVEIVSLDDPEAQ